MEYYFAYAFNLNPKNLCGRIERRVDGELGMLLGYDLVFNVRSKYNHKSFANIQKSPEHYVLGIVYLLTEKELEQLDFYEDVAIGTYKRVKVNVVLNKDIVSCWVYICNDKYWLDNTLKPTKEYVMNIIDSISEYI
jgi:gamma-glutamylcyclotransferase (GGCT)/AIG2-like uncharacterized protein YtfP